MSYINVRTKKIVQFPRPADVEFLLLWKRDGDQLFSDRSVRATAVQATSLLVSRLGMDARFERMRVESLSARHGGMSPRGTVPRQELLSEISRNLRVHGYVLRDFSARVPLTGMQLYVVRSLAHGHRTADIAADLGLSSSSVRETVTRTKAELGVLTIPEMVGCAYRNEWLPGHQEFLELSRMSSHPMAPGYCRFLR